MNAVCIQVHALVAGIGDIRPVTARDADMWIRVRNNYFGIKKVDYGRRKVIVIGYVLVD